MLVLYVEGLFHSVRLTLAVSELDKTAGRDIDIRNVIKPLSTEHDALSVLDSLSGHLHQAPFLPGAISSLDLFGGLLPMSLLELLCLPIGCGRAFDFFDSAVAGRHHRRREVLTILRGGSS